MRQQNINNRIISIYTINDFHGAIDEEQDKVGLSKLGAFLMNQKKHIQDTLILSAGDMLQGSALSEKTKGRVMVDAMNRIGFDAMAIGNHEFDWGIDELLKFHHDPVEVVQAVFPFLNANIIDSSTYEELDVFPPYMIKHLSGLNIGLIGTIGEQQKHDILASIVEHLTFSSQIKTIQKYAKVLRTQENCDIVIVLTHSDTLHMLDQLASLEGNEKIDAIVNAHTHLYYSGEIERANQAPLVYVQAGYGGKYIGKMMLIVDPIRKCVVDASSENLFAREFCLSSSSDLDQMIMKYKEPYPELLVSYGYNQDFVDKRIFIRWAVEQFASHYQVDLAVMNSGGIRNQAFPLLANQGLNYEKMFEIFPFDNQVVFVKMSMKQIQALRPLAYMGMVFSKPFEGLEEDRMYTVLINDYIYYRENSPFQAAQEVVFTDQGIRYDLIHFVEESVAKNQRFIPIVIERGLKMKKCFTINPLRSLSDFDKYDQFLSLGLYQGIEIFYPYQQTNEQQEQYLQSVQTLKSNHPSLEVVMHLPHGPSNSLTDLLHLQENIERMKKAMDFGAKCQVHKLTLHLGYVKDGAERESLVLMIQDVLRDLSEYALQYQMVLMIENMPGIGELGFSPEELLEIIEQTDVENLFFIMDTGHAHVSPYSLEEYIEVLGKYLVHIHLNDNFGERDEHMRLGRGSIDFESFFAALKKMGYDQLYCLEILHQQVEDLVEFARELDAYF